MLNGIRAIQRNDKAFDTQNHKRMHPDDVDIMQTRRNAVLDCIVKHANLSINEISVILKRSAQSVRQDVDHLFTSGVLARKPVGGRDRSNLYRVV